MSLLKPTRHDLERAYLHGLQTFDGDPEAGAEIGVPIGEEAFEDHVEAARVAAAALRRANVALVVGAFCADCMAIVEPGNSCPHLSVGPQGGRQTIG
ncbi:MAG TPA: hypothetical protein VMB52_02165 [Verrucomicrobiae bacterium]|nr:hypothetical protein [Verrucomicrobiae bacterium]